MISRAIHCTPSPTRCDADPNTCDDPANAALPSNDAGENNPWPRLSAAPTRATTKSSPPTTPRT